MQTKFIEKQVPWLAYARERERERERESERERERETVYCPLVIDKESVLLVLQMLQDVIVLLRK